jgi:hypothetical protein
VTLLLILKEYLFPKKATSIPELLGMEQLLKQNDNGLKDVYVSTEHPVKLSNWRTNLLRSFFTPITLHAVEHICQKHSSMKRRPEETSPLTS